MPLILTSTAPLTPHLLSCTIHPVTDTGIHSYGHGAYTGPPQVSLIWNPVVCPCQLNTLSPSPGLFLALYSWYCPHRVQEGVRPSIALPHRPECPPGPQVPVAWPQPALGPPL